MRFKKIEVFPGTNGKWYIRIRALNGRIVLTGGEDYASKGNARRAAGRVRIATEGAEVVVLD